MKRLILLSSLYLLSLISCLATTIYVDVDAIGTGTGLTWPNAYNNLQDALSVAASGDEIWVAEGVYRPALVDRSVSFSIPSGVGVYGGFNATESSRAQRNWAKHSTILSGNIGNPLDNSDNSFTIVRIEDQGDEVILDGFTIEAAYREISGINNFSAIVVSNDCRISRCLIQNNTGFASSAIHLSGNSNLHIDNCLFQSNNAVVGATVLQEAGTLAFSLLINQCTFAKNDHFNPGNEVSMIPGNWEIHNSIFWGNVNVSSQLSANLTVVSPISNSIVEGESINSLNVFDVDPHFNASSVMDFRLPAQSAAIDQADGNFVVSNKDLSCKPRINGISSDIGCYEHQGERIIYVDPINLVPTQDGSSWADAFSQVEDGVADAVGGDQIWLANGTHFVSTTNNREAYLSLRNDISIYGGFQGGGNEVFEDRDWRTLTTVISGNTGAINQVSDNVFTIFKSEEGANCLIDGITIQSAQADGANENQHHGGAVLVAESSSMKIQNCEMAHNYAEEGGVAVESLGELELNNCIIRDHQNTSIYDVVIHSSGDLVIRGCLFTRNDVALNLVLGTGSVMDIVNCTFYDNYTNGSGLRIGLSTSPAEVQNSVFSYNTFLQDVALEENALLFSHCILDDHNLTEVQIGEEVYFEDPLLMDPANDDFRLCWSSIGFDNGSAQADLQAEDFIGYNRVSSGGIDMGAIENTSARPVIYVDEAATDDNDGSSWEDAYTDLQDALYNATCGTEIWVAQGVYTPDPSNRFAKFEIPANTSLYGGFDGSEYDLEERDWTLNPTTLSGEIGNSNDITDNTIRIVQIPDGGSSVILDGFFVRYGYHTISDNFAGAAITTTLGRIELRNLRILDNMSDAASALRVYGENTVIENCLIANNHTEVGGTIQTMINGHLKIVNCTFTENTHTESYAKEIAGYAGTLNEIYNCIFYGNNSDSPVNTGYEVYNSLVEGGFDEGENILDLDPLFIDSANGNYQLQQISPAVDFGNGDVVKVEFDILGNDRVQGLGVDLGCFESSSTCAGDLNSDGVVNTGDLAILLANIGCANNCQGDLNNDNLVNTADLTILLPNYATTCGDL